MAYLHNRDYLTFNKSIIRLGSYFYLKFQRIANESSYLYYSNSRYHSKELIDISEFNFIINNIKSRKIDPVKLFQQLEYYPGVISAIKDNKLVGFNKTSKLVWVPNSTIKCLNQVSKGYYYPYNKKKNGIFVDLNNENEIKLVRFIKQYKLFYKVIEDENVFSTIQLSNKKNKLHTLTF